MPNTSPRSRQSITTDQPKRRLLRRRNQGGFTLIETMTTVAITGILATVATYSVQERVNEAHSAEAITMLSSMRKGIENSVNQTWGSGEILGIGEYATGFGGPLGAPALFGKGKGKGKGKSSSGADTYSRTGSKSGSDKELKDAGTEGADGNNGHGNDPDGCDASNPSGKCPGGDKDKGGSDTSSGSDEDKGGGPKHDAGTDDSDGNNGHGNDDDGCDSSNPGKSNPCSDKGGDDGGGDPGDNGGGDTGGGDPGDDGGGGGGDTTPESDADKRLHICGSATPIPSSFSAVQGGVYQASPGEWKEGDRHNSWACLNTSLEGTQRYQYGYDVGKPRIDTGTPLGDLPAGVDESHAFTAWARGDLDGDGRTSWFVLQGAVIDDQVYSAPTIGIVDQGE